MSCDTMNFSAFMLYDDYAFHAIFTHKEVKSKTRKKIYKIVS